MASVPRMAGHAAREVADGLRMSALTFCRMAGDAEVAIAIGHDAEAVRRISFARVGLTISCIPLL